MSYPWRWTSSSLSVVIVSVILAPLVAEKSPRSDFVPVTRMSNFFAAPPLLVPPPQPARTMLSKRTQLRTALFTFLSCCLKHDRWSREVDAGVCPRGLCVQERCGRAASPGRAGGAAGCRLLRLSVQMDYG